MTDIKVEKCTAPRRFRAFVSRVCEETTYLLPMVYQTVLHFSTFSPARYVYGIDNSNCWLD